MPTDYEFPDNGSHHSCRCRSSRRQNTALFAGNPERVPKRALTMSVGTISQACEIVLLVSGDAKAAIIAQTIEGPVTSLVSASALQLHANCKVVVDHASASQLQGREYYDFVFDNEPAWAAYRD